MDEKGICWRCIYELYYGSKSRGSPFKKKTFLLLYLYLKYKNPKKVSEYYNKFYEDDEKQIDYPQVYKFISLYKKGKYKKIVETYNLIYSLLKFAPLIEKKAEKTKNDVKLSYLKETLGTIRDYMNPDKNSLILKYFEESKLPFPSSFRLSLSKIRFILELIYRVAQKINELIKLTGKNQFTLSTIQRKISRIKNKCVKKEDIMFALNIWQEMGDIVIEKGERKDQIIIKIPQNSKITSKIDFIPRPLW